MHELAAGTRVDRYLVEEVLGRGGMAVVYRVRHAQLDSLHALKVLTIPTAAIRERLLTEGRIQARLDHPNVVSVTDTVDVGGTPGLVMEFVDGPSLDRLLAQGRLPMDQVDAIARGLLAGVAAAHEAGSVHRDLKPANILVRSEEGVPFPMVTDFGLAKLLHQDSTPRATRTNALMGTPEYMSPEQIESTRNVDAGTDVWAVGVILYEMLTGTRPFTGGHPYAVFQEIMTLDPGDPSTHDSDIPTRMALAVRAALVKDRDKRIGSVEELLAVWNGSESPRVLPAPVSNPVKLPVSRDSIESETTWDEERDSRDPIGGTPGVWTGRRRVLVGVVVAAALVLAIVGLGRVTTSDEPVESPLQAGAAQPVPEPSLPAVEPPPPAVVAAHDEPEDALAPADPVDDEEPAPVAAPKRRQVPPAPAPVVASVDEPPEEADPVDVQPPPRPEPALAPPSEPSGPPAGMAEVRVTGDADRVLLRSATGNVAPGMVPPGSYTVTMFIGTESTDAQHIEIAAGQVIELKCSRRARRCK